MGWHNVSKFENITSVPSPRPETGEHRSSFAQATEAHEIRPDLTIPTEIVILLLAVPISGDFFEGLAFIDIEDSSPGTKAG